MGLQPKIKRTNLFIKKCNKCGGQFGPESFSKAKSIFAEDGYLPICNDCIKDFLKENDFSWRAVDKLCQYADIPFIPSQFEKMREMNGENAFSKYSELFFSQEYEGIDWEYYYKRYRELKDQGLLEEELPLLSDERRQKLKEKWGFNYDDEALNYLENLFNGLMTTQNITGALQLDQALKICRISYEIDSRISAGQDFDKILASYDKLVRTAEFTPKNTKNAGDFESVGELFYWLEKRGFKNQYYNGVTKDIVDETLKNIQNSNRRLYVNETGISDEITRRIEALQSVKKLEGYYDIDQDYDLDNYDNDGYEELFKNEEFNAEV